MGGPAASWRAATRLAALACASALTLLAFAGPARGLDDPASRMQVATLSNGLTLLTLEDRTTPVVSLQIWVRVGSKDESRYTGIAHLFEHMMFKGSKHVAPEEHARLLESRGGRVNAFTSNDVTVYHEDLTPETLPLAIELEAERFANLDISDKTLASEREVVLEERRLRSEDSPEGRLFEALLALSFSAHPYRWPVIGWRSDVEAVDVAYLRQFFRTYYAPNNLVVAVVGNFDTAEALRLIERSFGGLEPAESVPRNPTKEPEQRGERRAVVGFDVRSPIVAVAWHAPKSGDPDGPALDVLGQILSAGRSSRLYQRLVDGEQQALAAQGGYWELQDAGLFFAYASVRPGASTAKVEALLLDEVERMRREPVGEEELAKVKKQLEVALVGGLTTTHALASRIAGDFLTFGRVRGIEERLAELRAVTAEDVRRVAEKVLRPDGRNVVQLVAPGGDATPAKGASAKSARAGARR